MMSFVIVHAFVSHEDIYPGDFFVMRRMMMKTDPLEDDITLLARPSVIIHTPSASLVYINFWSPSRVTKQGFFPLVVKPRKHVGTVHWYRAFYHTSFCPSAVPSVYTSEFARKGS